MNGFGKRVFAAAQLSLAALCLLGVTAPASSQTTTTYSNSTTGTVNASTVCTTPLVRTFSVNTNFVVADVNIGILATHTWRGDLQFTLQSPSGTRVQLTNGDTASVRGDNFNVLLDDAANQIVNTDSATGDHATTAPPYQNTFRPRSALSVFNGQNANGTWRLETCDLFPSDDNGSFRRADLYLTSLPANNADLSLSKTLLTTNPTGGSTATFRLTVSSAASSTGIANGIQVRDILPSGFAFTSASGTGTYNTATGIWSVGSLAPGNAASINLSGTVEASAGASFTNIAEIVASSLADPDSVPNNGATGEDDYATATLTVGGTRTAGTPPVLSCPNQTILFDWDTVSWANGSTNNNYPLGSLGNIGFNLTNDGTWLNNAAFGGQSPTRQNVFTGGFVPAQFSLAQVVDHTSRSGRAATTITLPDIMRGAQFRIFDVDSNSGQFADLVVVEGRYQGTTVLPTLTNGVSNYIIGNSAYGDGASDNNSNNGNVVVTFSRPIDTIIVSYGNHSAAPVDPGQQGIALHDIIFCRPNTSIVANKTSRVIDDAVDVGNIDFNIPGAVVEYCLLATNTGDTRATDIRLTDTIPDNVAYIPGSIRSGSSCANASTVEDDNAAGADESDPAGAQFLPGGEIRAVMGSLAAGGSVAFTFQVSIN